MTHSLLTSKILQNNASRTIYRDIREHIRNYYIKHAMVNKIYPKRKKDAAHKMTGFFTCEFVSDRLLNQKILNLKCDQTLTDVHSQV